MDQYIVKGGYPLRGRVNVGGAKNAALPIFVTLDSIMTVVHEL